MKIGMMLPATFAVGSPFNGIREQAFYQAEALQALGHTVTQMSPWEKYQLESYDVLHFLQGGPAFHDIENRLKELDTRLVFAPIIDSMMPNWRYRFAERLGRLHSRLDTIQSFYSRQANGSDAVVARSSYEKSKLVDGLGVSAAKIRIVLNGCPSPKQTNPDLSRRELGIEGDFILHLSKYTNATKNVLNMIKAIGPTGRQLVIAGTADKGDYLDAIELEAAKYANVRLVGKVNDSVRNSLYSACKIFCLPSYREGTGLVAVEAASYGAAIVITDNGGPPDYFKDHVDYVHTIDPNAIERAVAKAWERNSTVDLRNHVLETLSWQESGRNLVELYEGLYS